MTKLFYSILISSLFFVSCKESTKKIENTMYSGIDISDKVSIERDQQTKKATLKINIDDAWSLYTGTAVENIDHSKPVLEGSKAGMYEIPVSDSVRSYFKLVTPSSTMLLAEQHLPMEGGYNFRDLGGIKNKEGRYVKWGKILRSDDLHKLTEADLAYLSSVPLQSIVDFRSIEEINAAPDKLPNSIGQDYQLFINPGNLMVAATKKGITEAEAENLMMELNTILVSDSASISEYQKFFDLLENEKEIPLMFHCSAGKDRTGMGAALVLLSLGVDEDVVFENYLASNDYLGDKYSKYIDLYPTLKPFFIVKKEFLKAGLDHIKKEHGSFDNYLTNVLKVDLDKMKEMYLY